MIDSLFEGLENIEALYQLPNGKELKIACLQLAQVVEVHNRIQALPKDDTSAQLELHKYVMGQAVVNDEYQPYLDEATINRLARINGGVIPTEIFAKVMELSSADPKGAEAAKKK